VPELPHAAFLDVCLRACSRFRAPTRQGRPQHRAGARKRKEEDLPPICPAHPSYTNYLYSGLIGSWVLRWVIDRRTNTDGSACLDRFTLPPALLPTHPYPGTTRAYRHAATCLMPATVPCLPCLPTSDGRQARFAATHTGSYARIWPFASASLARARTCMVGLARHRLLPFRSLRRGRTGNALVTYCTLTRLAHSDLLRSNGARIRLQCVRLDFADIWWRATSVRPPASAARTLAVLRRALAATTFLAGITFYTPRSAAAYTSTT